MKYIRVINLLLLIAFPIAWFAPLLRAGILPLFRLSEISVMSGLQSLWQTDIFLALLTTVLALVAPYVKTISLACMHYDLIDTRALPVVHFLGKLAMADVFLLALYVVVIKGIGVGRVEAGWGLYAFTACILISLAISFATERLEKPSA